MKVLLLRTVSLHTEKSDFLILENDTVKEEHKAC